MSARRSNLGHRLRVLLGVVALICWSSAQRTGAAPPGERTGAAGRLRLPARSSLVGVFDQIIRAKMLETGSRSWKPDVNKEVVRGAAEVYAEVAPSVVVVRSPGGHGTGFVIDTEGWIVTNHHVVAHAVENRSSGIQQVAIHRGRLKDGFMRLDSEELTAYVYKIDRQKDLALLKLDRAPKGADRLPALRVAERIPSPGSMCLVVGHPAAAMLWTLRSGVVSAAGVWPTDMIDYVIAELALTNARDRQRLRELIATEPRRKVLISNCGINPGDSGGPLVDEQGRVVAVTFAMPGSESGGAASAAKFAYHVHLDELREFLRDRPERPPLHVADPLPPAKMAAVDDLDKDGLPDVLVFGMAPGDPPSGMWIDLDQDTAAKVATEKNKGAASDVRLWQRLWDFEFALLRLPGNRAFYDGDNDGRVDVILFDADGDGRADSRLRLVQNQWKRDVPDNQKMIDPSLIRNVDQRRKLAAAFGLKRTPAKKQP